MNTLPAHSCPLCTDALRASGTAEKPDLAAAVCRRCEQTYGPRVARLLARAESDPDFATACLAHLPPALRDRFAGLLAKRCFLPGADNLLRPGLRSARPRVDPKWLATAN